MLNPLVGQYGRDTWTAPAPSRRRNRQSAPTDGLVTCQQSVDSSWVTVARVPNTKAVRTHLATTPGNYRLLDGTRIVWSKRATGPFAPSGPRLKSPKDTRLPQRIDTRAFPAPADKVDFVPHGRLERAMSAARSLNV
jgi:hypothetical protein